MQKENLMKEKNTTDEKKKQDLQVFVQEVRNLLNKYPDIKIYSNIDGQPVAHTTIGSGYSTKSMSLQIVQ
jgi:hypothetical protein